MTLLNLAQRLRQQAASRYDFTLEAYYYCRHSKQSARLKRKLADQYELVAYYDAEITRRTKEDE